MNSHSWKYFESYKMSNETEIAIEKETDMDESDVQKQQTSEKLEEADDRDIEKNDIEEEDDDEAESLKPIYAPPYVKTGGPEKDGPCDAPMSRACGNYYWARDSVIPDYNTSQFGSVIYHKPRPRVDSQDEYEHVNVVTSNQQEQMADTANPLLTEKSRSRNELDKTPSKERRKPTDWMPEFKIMDIVLTLIACAFYLLDVISDWRLAALYYMDGELTLFSLTVSFILVPALISAAISAIWSMIDHKRYVVHEKHRNDEQNGHKRHLHWSATAVDKILFLVNVVFAAVQLGRCFRSLVFVAYLIKSWRTDKKDKRKIRRFQKKALEQKQDSAILGLVDGFLESSLQFFLQLYLSVSYKIKMDFLRVLTICMSWIATGLIHTAYYRNNRKVQRRAQNVSKTGAFVYFLWRMCELGPRFYIMVVFAYCFKYWSLLPLFLHFGFIMGLYIYQKPKLRGICCSKKSGYPFLFLVSYIGIFCYVNVKKGETKTYVLLYYMVFYLENILMVVLVYIFFPSLDENFIKWKFGVLILIPGFILHVILQIVYYTCFHPNKHVMGNEKEDSDSEKTKCANISKHVKNLSIGGIKVF